MKIVHKQINSDGFCPDLAPDTLPIGATSYSLNLKNTGSGWQKSDGFRATNIVPSVEGTFLAYYSPTKGDDRWMVASSTDIEMIYGGDSVLVGRDEGYSDSGSASWTAVDFNGVLIMNNIVDEPQYFASGDVFANLPNFPVLYKLRVLRKFGSYLIGLGVNTGSGFRDNDILWSHPADPGTVPASWDIANASTDAGLSTLPSAGFMVDCLELGNINVIYKADSIWLQRLIGGQYVFSFDRLFSGQGLISKDCVVEFEGKHFVLTQNDMITHDGNTMESVSEDKVRNFFFADINQELYEKTTVVTNPASSEIIIIYASNLSSDACDRALVWDWRQDAWEYRSLPNVIKAGYGYELSSVSATWDSITGDWAREGTWMSPESIAQYSPVLHFLCNDYESVVANSITKNWLDVSVDSVWESDTCVVGPLDRYGVPQQDYSEQKTVTMLAFDVVGDDPFEVFIRLKSRMGEDGDWESYGFVDPTVDKRLDLFETADYFGIRIVSSAHDFLLRSFHIEWFSAGEMW